MTELFKIRKSQSLFYEHEVFSVYALPSYKILDGSVNTFFDNTIVDDDKLSLEISSVINDIIEGDIKLIKMLLFSEVLEDKYGYLEQLNELIRYNISKTIYNSAKWHAEHEYKIHVFGRDCEEKTQNIRNIIFKDLWFAIGILDGTGFQFDVGGNASSSDILRLIKSLYRAYEGSNLPEMTDDTEFRALLYDVRISELMQEL